MLIRVEAELAIPAETYLLERDGAAFRSFIAGEMNLLEYDIVRCWSEGSATHIQLASKPDVGAWIPSSLSAKIPDKLEYFDYVAYHPDKLHQPPYELSIHSEVPFLGNKGHFTSRTIIEPVGPDRCRHILEQHIEFKGLWGLGAMAKRLAKKSLEQSFADMPGIIDKWVGVRQELLQTRHGRERLLAGRPHVEGVEWMEQQVAEIKQHGTHRPRGKGRHRPGEAEGAHLTPAPQPSMPAMHSPFADAALAAAAGADEGRRPAVAPAGGAAGGGGEANEFVEASDRRYARQDTGATAYFTPSASPAASAGAELPAGAVNGEAGAGHGPAKRGMPPVPEKGRGAGGEGSHGGGSEGGESETSGYAASQEGSRSSEEGVDWATSAPWRTYYLQRGLSPTRASRVLPDELVLKFVSGRRPVRVEKVATGVGQHGAAGGSGKHSRLGKLLGACSGKHTTAVE